MTIATSYLGAADEPWIVMSADIEAEINTVSALNRTTDNDLQANKPLFTDKEINDWHTFVEEYTAWKNAWLSQAVALRATSGAWQKVRDFKRRSIDWSNAVDGRLGSITTGKPRRPLDEKPWWGSAFGWSLVGVLGLVAGGYFVRSWGVASVTRAASRKKGDQDA